MGIDGRLYVKSKHAIGTLKKERNAKYTRKTKYKPATATRRN